MRIMSYLFFLLKSNTCWNSNVILLFLATVQLYATLLLGLRIVCVVGVLNKGRRVKCIQYSPVFSQ